MNRSFVEAEADKKWRTSDCEYILSYIISNTSLHPISSSSEDGHA